MWCKDTALAAEQQLVSHTTLLTVKVAIFVGKWLFDANAVVGTLGFVVICTCAQNNKIWMFVLGHSL